VTDAPIFLTATAYVSSTRPGALNPFDPAADSDAAPARFWAEPRLLPVAAALLEELGFETIAVDRRGVGILGTPALFLDAFGATVAWNDTLAAWRCLTDTGDETALIWPTEKTQQACLRAIVLEQEPTPVQTAADYERQVRAYQGDKPYVYATLPHELRRELCQGYWDDATLDALPRGGGQGKPLKIVVIDTGWCPTNRYWQDVGLGAAANGVTLLQSPYAVDITKMEVEEYEKAKQDLDALIARGRQYREGRAGAPPTAAQTAERQKWAQEVLTLFDKVADNTRLERAFSTADVERDIQTVKTMLKGGARVNGLADPGFASALLNPLAKLAAAAAKCIDQLLAVSRMFGMKIDSSELWDACEDHGTRVVGQILGIAPQADITLIPKPAGGIYRDNYVTRDRIRGFSFVPFLPAIVAIKPDVVSISMTRTISAVDAKDNNALRSVAIREFQQFVRSMRDINCAVVVAVGNSTTIVRVDATTLQPLRDKSGKPLPQEFPENNFVEPAAAHDNLIHVGGAWWEWRQATAPGRQPGTPRLSSCFASDDAVGYIAKRNGRQYDLPEICGLMAPHAGNDLLFHPVATYDSLTASFAAQIAPGDGTSFAAPQVAAIVALMLDANPVLKGQTALIRDLMIEQATLICPRKIGGNPNEEFYVPQGCSAAPAARPPRMVDLKRSIDAARASMPLALKTVSAVLAQFKDTLEPWDDPAFQDAAT
jgi:hypothetical protein